MSERPMMPLHGPNLDRQRLSESPLAGKRAASSRRGSECLADQLAGRLDLVAIIST